MQHTEVHVNTGQIINYMYMSMCYSWFVVMDIDKDVKVYVASLGGGGGGGGCVVV